MDVLKAVFQTIEDGDRILITFPDIYSFLAVSKWITDNYGELFWILWTDAAVERINHLGKKYGFPTSGDAIIIGSTKACEYLNVLDYLDVQSEIPHLPIDKNNNIIMSFGLDFLEIYNYDVNRAIEIMIKHNKGILVNTLLSQELVEKLLPFHDAVVEISKSKDTFVSYHTYVATLKFSMKGGSAVISNSFVINETFL